MKPRISARLPARLHAQLAGAAGRSQATQSAIVVAALESFLAARPDAGRTAALERRLDRLSRQLDRIERDGLLREETLALLARTYLTLTPLVPEAARAEAQGRGAQRWADFRTRLAARLAGGRRALEGVLEDGATDDVGVEAVSGDAREEEE